ncbi:hypothetical protein V8E54_008229 [Elaphomyces granulatus]
MHRRPRDEIISQFVSHFQLSTKESQECVYFLEDFLSKNGLLGANFEDTKSRPIEDALKETLRTANHNEVPSPILNSLTSPYDMRELVELSLRINSSYRARYADLPSVQVPHQKQSLENCTILVDNLVHPRLNSLSVVSQVLKDGASQPITHQDLDFSRWKDLLCEECGYDESYHLLECFLPATPTPYCVVLQNEGSWQSAILDMTNAGLTRCVFRMFQRNGAAPWISNTVPDEAS